jgi:hypothetical protein
MHMKSEDSKISHKSTVIDYTSRGYIMVSESMEDFNPDKAIQNWLVS